MEIVSGMPPAVGRIDTTLARPHLSALLHLLQTHNLGGIEHGEEFADLSVPEQNFSFVREGGKGPVSYAALDSPQFRKDLMYSRRAVSALLRMARHSIDFGQDDPNTTINLTIADPKNREKKSELYRKDRAWAERDYDKSSKPAERGLSEVEINKRFDSEIDPSCYQIVPSTEGVIYRLGDRTLNSIAPEIEQITAHVHRRGVHQGGFRALLEVEFPALPEVERYLGLI